MLRLAEETVFDLRHRIRTAGIVRPRQRGGPWSHAVQYQAVPARLFRQVSRALPQMPPATVFIDVGAGKGKAMLLASRCGFRRVVGIELDPDLARIATVNLLHARTTPSSTSTQVVCGDAATYAFPNSPLVVYMFNPFDTRMLRAVIDRLYESWLAYPRPVVLAYTYGSNLQRRTVTSDPRLRIVSDLGHSGVFEVAPPLPDRRSRAPGPTLLPAGLRLARRVLRPAGLAVELVTHSIYEVRLPARARSPMPATFVLSSGFPIDTAADEEFLVLRPIERAWEDLGAVRLYGSVAGRTVFRAWASTEDSMLTAVIPWLGPSLGALYVFDVETAPGERRRGYASAFLSEMLRCAAAVGLTGAYARIAPDNKASMSAFSKAGFVATATLSELQVGGRRVAWRREGRD